MITTPSSSRCRSWTRRSPGWVVEVVVVVGVVVVAGVVGVVVVVGVAGMVLEVGAVGETGVVGVKICKSYILIS